MNATESLYQLVYVSRRAEKLTRHDIVDGIVLPAMLKNRRLNISGCLWFDDGFFFQVMEGEGRDISRVYEAIEKDRRHHSIRVLAAQPIEKRDFERFSMRLISDTTPEGVRQLIAKYEAETPGHAASEDGFAMFVRRLITEISAQFV